MARSPIDLPRMQNQPRLRVAAARAPNLVPADDVSPPKRRKPRMMRQFELIDRVKQYNPAANEDLLNRAYVYAMRAHGEQKRASGDPYFSHPLQVAAILTDLKLTTPPSPRRCCTTPSKIPTRPVPRSIACSAMRSAIWSKA